MLRDKLYVAEAFGWMTVFEAADDRAALQRAQAAACSASLLPTDVTAQNVRLALPAELQWYEAMGGRWW